MAERLFFQEGVCWNFVMEKKLEHRYSSIEKTEPDFLEYILNYVQGQIFFQIQREILVNYLLGKNIIKKATICNFLLKLIRRGLFTTSNERFDFVLKMRVSLSYKVVQI
jgi:hypothetical protein